MTTPVLLYAAGALLEGWLAVMLAISGRALRGADRRWMRWLAAGFACNTARSVLLSFGYSSLSLADHPRALTSTLASVALALMTVALMDYVELGSRAKRRIWLFAGPLLAAIWLSAVLGWLPRGNAVLAACIFFFGWAALFVRAARREPHSGHALVVLAVLTFPAIVVALRLKLLPLELLPISEIVPLAAIGIAVLTTGLVRAHQRALRAGERTAQALAARQRAESELRAVNESLEQRVAQRTAHLEENIAGLESFNRSVSHDLRGPLGGIAGLAGIARAKVAEGHLDEAQTMLAAIERQADDSFAMVAALLELARAGAAQPQRAPVDTTALAGEVVAALEAAGKTASTQVVVQPLPDVEADPELLRQVFANLVGNACKFVRDRSAGRVEVGHASTSNGHAYFVRDNGIGFAPADAARLFRPFERLNGQRFEGAGVGLSIVKRIIDHHGGRVWAEGAPGAGATFWFTLGG
ncbi:MAG: HAMP domain-containing histidine kinase [Burkholderiales bacterium]|nr:HAMP domain-containing histidine kinase [Burkholderiales bacterium]